MIITTIADFIKSIPTATGTKWDAIESFVTSADFEIKTMLIGSDLYNYIAALTGTTALKTTLQNLIAFTAYSKAIPFVDLIQTPTGFAVVNNTNHAPASKERVERLLKWCDKEIDKNTDLLIMQVVDTAQALTEWKKFKRFNNFTNCLFLTGIDFAGYAKTENGSRADFLKVKGTLLAIQKNDLSEALSANYVAELVTQNRNNTLTEKNLFVVESCKLVMAKYVEKEEHEAEELLTQIVVMMEKTLTDYPAYSASAEYALKNMPTYQNKATDSTFFFN